MRTFTRVAGAADPASWAFTVNNGGVPADAAGGIAAYGGVNTTTPVDVFGSAVATSATSHVAPSVTTTVAGTKLLGFYGLATGTAAIAVTPPASMTERFDVQSSGAASRVTSEVADQTLATAGASGSRTATSAAATSVSTTIALKPAGGGGTSTSTTTKYGFSGGGDSPDFTMDNAGAVIERSIGVLGGVSVTKRAGGDVWSYPNIHGDIAAVADAAGTKQGSTLKYDPHGQALAGLPDNSAGNYDYGWLGQHQRGLEHEVGLATVEMGARQYVPGLGRFLSADPIEGGSCSDYDYVCADPINALDLSGELLVPVAIGVLVIIAVDAALTLGTAIKGPPKKRQAHKPRVKRNTCPTRHCLSTPPKKRRARKAPKRPTTGGYEGMYWDVWGPNGLQANPYYQFEYLTKAPVETFPLRPGPYLPRR